jgi:molybdate transport system substrate-binding protein
MKMIIATLLVSCLLVTTDPAWSSEVRLFAAASMAPALKEMITDFEKQNPQTRVLASFTSSGALARQIVAGAPADIFISADQHWIDYLLAQEQLDPATVRVLAANIMVVAGPVPAAVTRLEQLPLLRRIAIATPDASPAGRFARAALEGAGLYQQLLRENRLIQVKDVLQAIMYLERGEVDAALVYRTDALQGSGTEILFEIPRHLYPAVTYPVSLTRAGTDNPAARLFFRTLTEARSREILARYGFTVP